MGNREMVALVIITWLLSLYVCHTRSQALIFIGVHWHSGQFLMYREGLDCVESNQEV